MAQFKLQYEVHTQTKIIMNDVETLTQTWQSLTTKIKKEW